MLDFSELVCQIEAVYCLRDFCFVLSRSSEDDFNNNSRQTSACLLSCFFFQDSWLQTSCWLQFSEELQDVLLSWSPLLEPNLRAPLMIYYEWFPKSSCEALSPPLHNKRFESFRVIRKLTLLTLSCCFAGWSPVRLFSLPTNVLVPVVQTVLQLLRFRKYSWWDELMAN